MFAFRPPSRASHALSHHPTLTSSPNHHRPLKKQQKTIKNSGELRVVGCTSLDKFRKFLEKDPGLERRFQQVAVEPPSAAQALSILRGLRPKYETHHGLRISDAALAAAAALSERYLPER